MRFLSKLTIHLYYLLPPYRLLGLLLLPTSTPPKISSMKPGLKWKRPIYWEQAPASW